MSRLASSFQRLSPYTSTAIPKHNQHPAARNIFYSHPPVLPKTFGALPHNNRLLGIQPQPIDILCIPPRTLISFGIRPQEPIFGVLPTMYTFRHTSFSSASLKSPPLTSCYHSLPCISTIVQCPAPTLVALSHTMCPGCIRAQSFKRSHCVLAAELLAGSLLFV